MFLNIQVNICLLYTFPAPKGDPNAPLQALIFDSYYDSYKGVIVYIRVKEGTVKTGMKIRMMATGAEFTVVETGVMGATTVSYTHLDVYKRQSTSSLPICQGTSR